MTEINIRVGADADVQTITDTKANQMAIGLLASLLPRAHHKMFISMLESSADGVITIKDSDSNDSSHTKTLALEAFAESVHQMVQIANELRGGVDKAIEAVEEEQGIDYLDDAETITLIVKALGGIGTINRTLEAGGTVAWKMPSEDS